MASLWWLPGILVAAVDTLAMIAAFATGGPDLVGGLVFGSVALAAAAVILWRRAAMIGETREDGKTSPTLNDGEIVDAKE